MVQLIQLNIALKCQIGILKKCENLRLQFATLKAVKHSAGVVSQGEGGSHG
jgi:hypothetical protein